VPSRISFAGYAMPAQQRHEASLVFLKYQDKSNSHFPLSNYRIVPVRASGSDKLKIIVHVSYDCDKVSPEGTYSFSIER
jgi:hypothetical protein